MSAIYARIRSESKYFNQDPGKPFKVKFVGDRTGYVWSGNDNRYRATDLILMDSAGFAFQNPARMDVTLSTPVFVKVRELAKQENRPMRTMLEELLTEAMEARK
jgi:hypothetical protein